MKHEFLIFLTVSPQNKLQFAFSSIKQETTIVGILTFISRINYWLWLFKPEISINFGYFSIYEQFKFHAHLS